MDHPDFIILDKDMIKNSAPKTFNLVITVAADNYKLIEIQFFLRYLKQKVSVAVYLFHNKNKRLKY